ncbi:hypothetical protein EAE99_011593 [Botrytis elliptica]|nr:hypothetical protein EAE99_011593 [Botrytis elliptica]
MPSAIHHASDSSSESESDSSTRSKYKSNNKSLNHKRKKSKSKPLIPRIIKLFFKIVYTPHLLKIICKVICFIALLFIFQSQLTFVLNGVSLIKRGVSCAFDPWGCLRSIGQEMLGVGSSKMMGMGEKEKWKGKTGKEPNFHTSTFSPYSSPSSFNYPYQDTPFTSSSKSNPISPSCDEIINSEDKFFLGPQPLLTFTNFSDPFSESLEQLIFSLNITLNNLLFMPSPTSSPSPSPSPSLSPFSIFPNQRHVSLTTLQTTLHSLKITLNNKITAQKVYHKSLLHTTTSLTSTTHTYVRKLGALLTQLDGSIQKLRKHKCKKQKNWMVKTWNSCNALQLEGERMIEEIQILFGAYFGELRGVGVLEGLAGEVLESVRKGREIGETISRMRIREREIKNDLKAKVGDVIYQDLQNEMSNFFGEFDSDFDIHAHGLKELNPSPLKSFIARTRLLEEQMQE